MSKISIDEIESALIDGGVTDGEHTVFYEDVRSASVTTKRPLLYRFYSLICWGFVFLGGWSVIMFFEGGTNYGIGDVLGGIFVAALFGFGIWVLSFISVTLVKTSTEHGNVTLKFWQKFFRLQDNDIGREVAQILNLRRRQPHSPETRDFKYSLGVSDKLSFTIENDALTIYDTGDHTIASVSDDQSLQKLPRKILAFVDLTNVVRVESKFRSQRSTGCILYRNAVVFEFRSGQKSTHYIKVWDFSRNISIYDSIREFLEINQSPWFGTPEISKELYQAVSSYLQSRESSDSLQSVPPQ